MSANSSRPRRRWGCLTRLLVFVLFMGACYWLLLAPISESGTDQAPETTAEAPSEGLSIEGEVNSTQRAALEEMANDTGERVDVLAQNGQIQYLTLNVKVPDSVAVSAQDKASYFLQQNQELFQVQNPGKDFKSYTRTIDETGATFISYTQEYQGIPIYGADVIVEVNKQAEIGSVMAGYSPSLSLNVQPTIRSTQAEQIVLDDLGDPDGHFLIPTSLTIFDERLFEEDNPTGPRLAWDVMVASQTKFTARSYLIDANSGEILLILDEFISGLKREVWDAGGYPGGLNDFFFLDVFLNDKQVMDESGPIAGASPDDDAQRAWRHAGTVYSYYSGRFKRDSYDNKGGSIKMFVNIGDCRNSVWWAFGEKAFFCENYTGLDLIAHELTHGVWATGSFREFYKGEAAALNESFSDIFAAFIDERDPWRITVDDSTDERSGQILLRNLANPDSMGYPTSYKQYQKKSDPHWNSTINSYAAYLLSEGTPNRNPVKGVTVTGIGRIKAQYIYYNVMTHRLKAWVNFKETRKATIAACERLIGTYEITSSDCNQVMNAYAAVEIGEPAYEPPAPPISLPELPNLSDLINSLREELRQVVDEFLGDWSPLKYWDQIQAEIDRIRNNYWVKLLECIKNSDQACIDKYAVDLVNAIYAMVMNALCNFCSSFLFIPAVVFAVRKQKRLIL